MCPCPRRKAIISSIVLACVLVCATHGQHVKPPPIQWQQTFGGDSLDYGMAAVLQTADDGFVIGATSLSGISGNKISPSFDRADGSFAGDFWILRIDSEGNKLWDHSFGGNGWDGLSMVQPVEGGGFLLAGESNSTSGGSKSSPYYGGDDIWLVRLDDDGSKMWELSLGGSSVEFTPKVLQTGDGGFLVVCGTWSAASGNKTSPFYGGDSDTWVIRVDSSGNKLLDRTFAGYGADQINAARKTADGGFIRAAFSS